MKGGIPFSYRARTIMSKLTENHLGSGLRVPLSVRKQTPAIKRIANSKKVSLAIFDWAGTTVNPYSTAPLAAMIETFAKVGMQVSMEEARGPMGISKIEHIRAISKLANIETQWKKKHGRIPDDLDVDKMYQVYLPLQLACLHKHSDLISGTAKTIAELQQQDILIGTTTGFTREMLDIIIPKAAAQGYIPDATVAGDDVAHGSRPNPHMIFKNMDLLDINYIQGVVKVGDTVIDIEEGLSAGCWTVGVSAQSSLCEINSLEHENELAEEMLVKKRTQAHNILAKAGAHYVIHNLSQLPQVIQDINYRLSLGELPIDELRVLSKNQMKIEQAQIAADLCLEGDLLPSSSYRLNKS